MEALADLKSYSSRSLFLFRKQSMSSLVTKLSEMDDSMSAAV